MIGQILPRGTSTRGLLYYLFTEGLAGEKGLESAHTDPRVIASWDGRPQVLQPPFCAAGRRDFTEIASRLNEPLALLGFSKDELRKAKPVYHLTIAAAKDPETGELVDRLLTDQEWAEIAAVYMDRLGLARNDDPAGVRWVAVRHADDHVHVIATLARQDGRRAHPSNDWYRSREASRYVEDIYGLRTTSVATGTGSSVTSRAEVRKHRDTAGRRQAAGLAGPAAPDREVLRQQVRVAAAGADNLGDFLRRLRLDGLLVRERFSERNPGEVTGYAVALPDRYDSGGKPIFFGGGKLASDLTVPRLQRRWQQTNPGVRRPAGTRSSGLVGVVDRYGLTRAERLGIWQQATQAATTATEQITASAGTDPTAAADAAWATSDFLAAAARVVEGRRGGPLSTAAACYDHAARELFGHAPAPTGAGQGLRIAGRLLLTAQVAYPGEIKQLLALLAQLAALTDAVTRLRETQQRAAQATAARQAAEQLRAVTAGVSRRVEAAAATASGLLVSRPVLGAQGGKTISTAPTRPSRGPRI